MYKSLTKSGNSHNIIIIWLWTTRNLKELATQVCDPGQLLVSIPVVCGEGTRKHHSSNKASTT